jgi:hypothetical protein
MISFMEMFAYTSFSTIVFGLKGERRGQAPVLMPVTSEPGLPAQSTCSATRRRTPLITTTGDASPQPEGDPCVHSPEMGHFAFAGRHTSRAMAASSQRNAHRKGLVTALSRKAGTASVSVWRNLQTAITVAAARLFTNLMLFLTFTLM